MRSKDTVTVAEARALAATAKGTKYGNTRGVYVAELDRRFDSQHEAEVAVGLRRREQAGEITDLRFQVAYPIEVNGVHVCNYISDFVWRESAPVVVENRYLTASGGHLDLVGWREVVADAKGFSTPTYKLKRALMKAVLGITIVEL